MASGQAMRVNVTPSRPFDMAAGIDGRVGVVRLPCTGDPSSAHRLAKVAQ